MRETHSIKAFCELVKSRTRPEGSISPDGKRIKRGGKWVPVKSRKKQAETSSLREKLKTQHPHMGDDPAFYNRQVEIDRSDYVGLKSYAPTSFVGYAHMYLTSQYATINRTLRDGGNLKKRMGRVSIARVVNDLRSSMSAVKEDIQVFRGLGISVVPKNVDRIPLNSFVSTSTSFVVATGYTPQGNDGCVVSFKVPKGTQAIVANKGEQEVTLPPGKSLKVKERLKRKDGLTVLFCELKE